MKQPSPTDLPHGSHRSIPIDEVFQDARGGLWRLAENGPAGARRFVPASMQPADVPRLFWAREGELLGLVGQLRRGSAA